ncbi:ORF099 [Infectious spleen and kidney necrosis virus]|nr:ORF099 [Infectious spleen and kidney necrosis virus]
MYRNELFDACTSVGVHPAMYPDHTPTSYSLLNANMFATPHTEDQTFTAAAAEVTLAGMDNQRVYNPLQAGDSVLNMVKAIIKTKADDCKVKVELNDPNKAEDPKKFTVTEFTTTRISTDFVMIDSCNLWRVENNTTDAVVFNVILVGGQDTSQTYQVHSLEHAYVVSRNII